MKRRKVIKKQWFDKRSKKIGKRKQHKKVHHIIQDTKSVSIEKKAYNFMKDGVVCKKILPERFSLVDNTEETMQFFSDVINTVKNGCFRQTTFFCSKDVKYASEDALIYLIAIMCNMKFDKNKDYIFKGDLPKNKEVEKVYEESGFMEYVESDLKGIPKCTDKMKIVTGNKNKPDIAGSIIDFVVKKLNKTIKETMNLQKILVELMSNVFFHAYNKEEEGIMYNRWYMYAEKKGDTVRLLFVDTGLGIAQTVRKNHLEKIIRKFSKTPSDGVLIKETFICDDYRRSSTSEKHRGNGLSAVKSWVEDDMFRSFQVISGYGGYKMEIDEKGNKVFKHVNYKNSIEGTMYVFDII